MCTHTHPYTPIHTHTYTTADGMQIVTPEGQQKNTPAELEHIVGETVRIYGFDPGAGLIVDVRWSATPPSLPPPSPAPPHLPLSVLFFYCALSPAIYCFHSPPTAA